MTTASATRTITDLMWSETASIYDAILAHPFIKGLTSGDLERSAFEFYTVQDALYLKDYARALSL
ncbi:MAG: thiaminase II, partial [Chloroflexota bacterium]|nr:thiaminase II [Chloroflexota bacterium]